LRELLRYFVEEGKVSRDAAGRWTTDRPIKELGIPPSVRDVLVSRLSRLSEPARKLIGVGCAFEGPVNFNVVSDVAGLTEDEALDALDEAVRAQVVRYAGGGDAFAFTHALTRSAVYAELSPPRQVRLHRRVAEALENTYGERAGPTHAGEIAAKTLADRVGRPIFNVLQAQEGLAFALDEGLEELLAAFTPLASTVIPALAWGLGFIYGTCALAAARLGQEQVALKYLALLVPWLERAPAWHVGFPVFASDAAETIWRLERLEHAAVVEYAVREKVIQPDFRTPMADGRLALARVCALQGRHDEAQKWLGEARRVLDQQRALPLLAIADFDEALMSVRRGGPRHQERALPVLDAARAQFTELGMTGWQRRADELHRQLG
jgi:hypothetical protein